MLHSIIDSQVRPPSVLRTNDELMSSPKLNKANQGTQGEGLACNITIGDVWFTKDKGGLRTSFLPPIYSLGMDSSSDPEGERKEKAMLIKHLPNASPYIRTYISPTSLCNNFTSGVLQSRSSRLHSEKAAGPEFELRTHTPASIFYSPSARKPLIKAC